MLRSTNSKICMIWPSLGSSGCSLGLHSFRREQARLSYVLRPEKSAGGGGEGPWMILPAKWMGEEIGGGDHAEGPQAYVTEGA